MRPIDWEADYRKRLSANAEDFDSIISDLLREHSELLGAVVHYAKSSPSGDIDVNPSPTEELLISVLGSARAKEYLGIE
ncbi:MAG: hypothetical protein GWO28_01185 [candidate division Zixibacteria bacterium]|nr:hypothetical protein [candidate division Zixibacteria bacterium]